MLTLKEMIKKNIPLSEVLKKNAEQHRRYDMYTSMERALGVLHTGEIYISNGANWNDVNDRTLMDANNAYGLCLSCSTRENIAMWMLYGANHGKDGAMLMLYPSVMKDLVNAGTIELGYFQKNGKFHKAYTLKNRVDYEAYLSDVVYIDPCKDGMVRLTEGESHVTVNQSILKGSDIYYKDYAWSYEKECRFVIKLNDYWIKTAKNEKLPNIRVKMSDSSRNKMTYERLIRSPVYSGTSTRGVDSKLFKKVDWNL